MNPDLLSVLIAVVWVTPWPLFALPNRNLTPMGRVVMALTWPLLLAIWCVCSFMVALMDSLEPVLFGSTPKPRRKPWRDL